MPALAIIGTAIMMGGANMTSSVQKDNPVEANAYWAKTAFSAKGGPFSFVYGGKPSSEFLGSWTFAEKKTRPGKGRDVRTATWTDPDTALEVKAVVTVYTDTAGVDWTLHLTNKGDRDAPAIENLRAIDCSLPGGKQAVFRGIHGCYPHNWQPFDAVLEPGKPMQIGATNGCSSENHSPFFNVDAGKGGIVVGVGWSGQWIGSIERAETGEVRVQAGMEFLHLKLHPGESIRSPRILAVRYAVDAAEADTEFRRTMLAHVMPRSGGKLQTPPVAHLSTSFDELNATDEPSLMSHLKSLKGLGFTHFWLDAYFTKGGFPDGMGNYGLPPDKVIPDPVRFPNGIKPVAEAVAKDGLKFLVWFEPERTAGGTLIAREHPEFIIPPSGAGPSLFNLGLPEAREYMTRTLDAAIKDWHLGCIRFDYNFSPLSFWQQENAKHPDRVGITEIRYVEGLYRMWDDLRAANPGLLIDNCAGGGRRIDLETSARAVALWRTDATIGPLLNYDFDGAALINQVITGGLSRYVPYSTSGQMGATPYQFRSGVCAGGISFAEDVRAAKDKSEAARKGREEFQVPLKELYGDAGYPRELLKQGIAEAKRTRKYAFGDFYAVSAVTASPADWCVFQYHRQAEEDGMLVAFRRPQAPATFHCSSLKGIDPQTEYLVTFAISYKTSKPIKVKGSALRNLELKVDDCPGSVLVEYRRAK